MRFSKRTGWPSEPNALSGELMRLRSEGAGVVDLTESNPTRCGILYPAAEILAPFRDPLNLIYEADPRGLASAREEVCRYYAARGADVRAEDVFLFASTSEAYAAVLRLMLDPGDRVLAPAPSYPLFEYLAGLSDAQIHSYGLRYEGGWKLEPEGFREALEESRARVVIFVNPNNPTGNYVSAEEREAAVEACNQAGAAVIADEVFFDYAAGQAERRTFASEERALTFTLGGVSKAMALPQMKLAWLVVSGPGPERREAARRLEIIADTFLSVNTPSQRALGAWFRLMPEIQQAVSERVSANRARLEEEAARSGAFALLEAQGGWHAVLRADSRLTDEEICLSLLREKRLWIHPGYFFDFHEGTFLVASLIVSPERMEEGAPRLSSFLAGIRQ